MLAAGVGGVWFLSLARPPGTPPGSLSIAVGAAVWALTGIGGWLVRRRSVSVRPLRLGGWQLAVTALWIPAFFGLRQPPLGLAVLLVLLPLIGLIIRRFASVDRIGAGLLIPCLLGTGYSLYLNAGFCWLNPG